MTTYTKNRYVIFPSERIVVRMNKNPRDVSLNPSKARRSEENVTGDDSKPNRIYNFKVVVQ